MKAYSGDLYRGLTAAPVVRADETKSDDAHTSSSFLEVNFAVFDAWTEIHSWYEGDFLERLSLGSFTKTMKENRSGVVIQFDHGYDMHVGDLPLAPVVDLREDDAGAWIGGPLLNTDYNRDRILPLLAGRDMDGNDHGSLLGASFRFRVIKDEWDDEPGRSDHNPDGLPERTIKEVRLYEAGPVVFPAYPQTSAGLRSVCLTDRYEARAQQRRSRSDAQPPPALDTPPEPPAEHSDPTSSRAREELITDRFRRKLR